MIAPGLHSWEEPKARTYTFVGLDEKFLYSIITGAPHQIGRSAQ